VHDGSFAQLPHKEKTSVNTAVFQVPVASSLRLDSFGAPRRYYIHSREAGLRIHR
jgi:hypothetical protein